MYNQEYKEAYFKDIGVSDNSIKQYNIIFNSTSEVERTLGKDLYDMTFDELEVVFYRAKYKKINSLINYISTIKAYITWCKSKGYGEYKDHPIVQTVNENFVSKYIFKEGSRYVTKEMLYEEMELILNVQHKALVLCLFEGIKGRAFSEIVNLKYDDLYVKNGEYYAHVLVDEIDLIYREVKITDKLYELLIETYKKSEMYSIKGRLLRVIPGDYIFRNNGNKDKEAKLNTTKIGIIFTTFIKDAFVNANINATYIYVSGIMHKINEMMGDRRVLDKKLAEQIIFEMKLGTQVINDKEYPVYVNLRRMIDEDFIREKYGDFKMEI